MYTESALHYASETQTALLARLTPASIHIHSLGCCHLLVSCTLCGSAQQHAYVFAQPADLAYGIVLRLHQQARANYGDVPGNIADWSTATRR